MGGGGGEHGCYFLCCCSPRAAWWSGCGDDCIQLGRWEGGRKQERKREDGHTFVFQGIPPIKDLGIQLVLLLEGLCLMQHSVHFLFGQTTLTKKRGWESQYTISHKKCRKIKTTYLIVCDCDMGFPLRAQIFSGYVQDAVSIYSEGDFYLGNSSGRYSSKKKTNRSQQLVVHYSVICCVLCCTVQCAFQAVG